MLSSKTVFLVEDDCDDRDFFISALDDIENVTLFDVAGNGSEAIDKLQRSSTLPSMIFMDIKMPIMDGLECLQQLAKDPQMNSIPVVMLSSSTQYRDRARFLGATAFIEKPNSIELLRDKLEDVMQSATHGFTPKYACTV